MGTKRAISLPLLLKRFLVCKYSCSFYFKRVEFFEFAQKENRDMREAARRARLAFTISKTLLPWRNGVYHPRGYGPGFRKEFRHLTNVPSLILNRIREKCSALPQEREMLTH